MINIFLLLKHTLTEMVILVCTSFQPKIEDLVCGYSMVLGHTNEYNKLRGTSV